MTQVDYGNRECIPKKAECKEKPPAVSNICTDKGKVSHCNDGFKRKFKQLWDRAFASLISVNGKTQEAGTGNVTLHATDIMSAGAGITIVDDVISAELPEVDAYTKSETDALLADKADVGDSYTKSETDDLLDSKQGILTAGAGIAIADDVISCTVPGFSVRVLPALPATGEPYTIYLIPVLGPSSQNIYNEFIWVNDAWEQIGTTQIDLSQYKVWSETKAYIDSHIPTVEVLE